MHRFLRFPRLEAALACFRGAGIEDDLSLSLLLVLRAGVWECEGGGGREGEEEDESLGEVGELHCCACGWVLDVVWIE